MGDISKHFSRSEIACKCKDPKCTFASIDIEQLALLEKVREHFKKPIRVNSGCRCHYHNIDIGGAEYSKHRNANATDITIDGVTPSDIAHYANTIMPDHGGIIIYETFCHLDTRKKKYRSVRGKQ